MPEIQSIHTRYLVILRLLCYGPVVNGPISIGLRTKYEKKILVPDVM